ncbi:MAG: T9SS type A sorting domain-containing protein [Bacteroidota bacterium]|nr:T9SS type A sorting domain-containing protein [Bacteroidota bacterium]
MKSLVTIFYVLLLSAGLNAQDVKQQVVSSAGGYDISSDNSMSLSWTLGELVISTAEAAGGDLILTQGFQQSKLLVTGINLNPEHEIDVILFPNPAKDILNIRFSEPLNGETMIFLSGPDGRLIDTEIIKPGVLVKEINMQKYPAGNYFIRMKNGDKHNVYKIIKL